MSMRSRPPVRSEEHTSELQSHSELVCRLLLEKKKTRWELVRRQARYRPRRYARWRPCRRSSRWPGNRRWWARRCFRRRQRPFFFFNDTATTEIYTLSLHDALPISLVRGRTLGSATAASANQLDN